MVSHIVCVSVDVYYGSYLMNNVIDVEYVVESRRKTENVFAHLFVENDE